MKHIKVSEATNTQLDYLVAKAMGHTLAIGDFGTFIPWTKKTAPVWQGRSYRPSTDWSQGGPIIEREKIKTDPRAGSWTATIWNEAMTQNPAFGPTPLIAAMRCFVASKLGDTVEVPEELL